MKQSVRGAGRGREARHQMEEEDQPKSVSKTPLP